MSRKTISYLLVLFLLIGTLTVIGFAKGGNPQFKILLVGYGWYYGIPEGQVNNAELIAKKLHKKVITARDGKKIVGEAMVRSIVIPVTWSGAWPPVEAKIMKYQPDIVVGLGTSPGASAIRPEPHASNVMRCCDALPPDDPLRECKQTEPIEVDGPDYRDGNLPYTDMVLAMSKKGIPARRGHETGYIEIEVDNPPCEAAGIYPSATPGWYLCNFLTWKLAKYVAEEDPDLLAGFIHIPTQPEYVAWDRYAALDALDPGSQEYNDLIEKEPSASMKLKDMIRGIKICLKECVRAKAGQ